MKNVLTTLLVLGLLGIGYFLFKKQSVDDATPKIGNMVTETPEPCSNLVGTFRASGMYINGRLNESQAPNTTRILSADGTYSSPSGDYTIRGTYTCKNNSIEFVVKDSKPNITTAKYDAIEKSFIVNDIKYTKQ